MFGDGQCKIRMAWGSKRFQARETGKLSRVERQQQLLYANCMIAGLTRMAPLGDEVAEGVNMAKMGASISGDISGKNNP